MLERLQKVWVVYLITSYTVFTLPEPVFSAASLSPVYGEKSNSSSDTDANPKTKSYPEPTDIGEDLIAEASSIFPQDNVIAEASSFHSRGPPRKHPPHPPRRPRRRHPPGPPLPPHEKVHLSSHSPKNSHSNHPFKKPHTVPKNRDRDDKFNDNFDHKLRKLMSLEEDKIRQDSLSTTEIISQLSNLRTDLTSKETETDRSLLVEDDFFSPGAGGRKERGFYSDEVIGARASHEGSPTSIRKYKPHGENGLLKFPKLPRPVQLSYYYDSNDKKDLRDLVTNHHLRRRKDCDGLENFTYDLEVIAFLLGIIATGIGFYSDVIPFFNEGVKITYNNDYLGAGGEGIDFPHSYWPPKGKTELGVQKRTISIGTSEDNQREVLSVTGEFIGLAGLIISFFTLFPSTIEKFFYLLDWWFGKRGLWKQYLYTYKCEVHPYPKPGWGR